MRWFCALTEDSPLAGNFMDMVKVAVHTAQMHTSLRPHFIYDGGENSFTEWLRDNGVDVILMRVPFYAQLCEIADRREQRNAVNFGAGAFLRTTIPTIAKQRGFAEETVLYTDCDVMFVGDVVPYLSSIKPRYFAVAPESNPKDLYNINTGVMLMNLAGLSTEEEPFQRFLTDNLGLFTDTARGSVYDQTAYEYYYRPITRFLMEHHLAPESLYKTQYHLAKLRRPLWQQLPLEYNWKPYWGENPEAKIIHFHGPKPCATSPYEHSHFRPPSFDYWRGVWQAQFDELSSRS